MSKVLPVPYFIQPTAITCQSTVLKMVAAYLDQYLNKNMKYRNVLKIWRTINKSANRPVKRRNHYINMKWWLENEFPNIFDFPMKRTVIPKKAVSLVIKIINAGFPVIVSTNHTRTKGHIILIIGYKLNYSSTEYSRSVHNERNTLFVCHDPYGRFDPQLKSNKYGRRRFRGAMSTNLGEEGPGKNVEYDISGIRRIRADRAGQNVFRFLYPINVSV